MANFGFSKMGKLSILNIRSVWKGEAGSFTPWLNENLALLGAALSLELEAGETEVWVGNFRLDLVTRDSDGIPVIVENQFGQSDHKHLGQILTYASGYKSDEGSSKTVVWIAEDFCPEHLSALEWLNRITPPDINFFAVEVKALQVDKSLPAPFFKVVSRPNNWTKAAARDSTATGASYIEFWQACKKFLNDTSHILKPGTPKAQYWLSAATGAKPFKFAFTASVKDGYVGCEVKYNGPNAPEVLDRLKQKKQEIENEYGRALTWELVNATFLKIRDAREGNISQRSSWTEFQEWFLTTGERLFKAVIPRVKELYLPEDISEEQE